MISLFIWIQLKIVYIFHTRPNFPMWHSQIDYTIFMINLEAAVQSTKMSIIVQNVSIKGSFKKIFQWDDYLSGSHSHQSTNESSELHIMTTEKKSIRFWYWKLKDPRVVIKWCYMSPVHGTRAPDGQRRELCFSLCNVASRNMTWWNQKYPVSLNEILLIRMSVLLWIQIVWLVIRKSIPRNGDGN